MSNHELESKVRELRQLQALIEEAQTEAETIKDQLKAHMGSADELRAGEYKVTWKTVKFAQNPRGTRCLYYTGSLPKIQGGDSDGTQTRSAQ